MKKRIIFGLLFVLFSVGIIIPNAPNSVNAAESEVFFEDFEGTVFPPWTATGLWHIEDNNTSSFPFSDIPSGTKYAWYGNSTSPNGTYETYYTNGTASSNSGELISGILDFTSFSGQLRLEFFSHADTEAGDMYDRKEVYVSGDAGASWTLVGLVYAENVTLGWQYISFDISDFINSTSARIKFSFDTVDAALNNYRGWSIDDIKISDVEMSSDEFNLWINQDYHSLVGDTRWMDFFAFSQFSHFMPNITIGIDIIGPGVYQNLFYDSNIAMPAYGSWNKSISYTFPYVGPYEVYFYLIDDIGVYWETWCHWEIKPLYEHFELWIEQEHFAVVGQYGWMDFYIESYFNHGMWVDIEIEVYGPILSDIILSDTIYLPANGSWFYYDEYFFTYSGDYDIRFTLIDDKGEIWEAWCWYKVFDQSGEFLYVDIGQGNYACVGEKVWMDIFAYSNFSYDLYDLSVFAEIVTPRGYNDTLYSNTNLTIYSYSWWDVPIPYTFIDEGYYEVWVYITLPTGETWHINCWWEVDPEPTNLDLELILDFEKEISVNENNTFTLNVKNHFDFPVEFWVNFSITSDSGENNSIYEYYVPLLQPGTLWTVDIHQQFAQLGEYTLLFEVEMIDGTYYSIEEYMKVYDPDPSNTSDTTTIPNLTSGFEIFLLPLAIVPFIYMKKKRR